MIAQHYKKIILLVVIIFLIVLNVRLIQQRLSLKKEMEFLENELIKLEQKGEELSSQISDFKDEDYLEKIGREDFNLKKEGEKVVAFPMKEMEEDNVQEKKDNFWTRILKKIGLRD